MTPETKQLIQESWEHVVPISETAATLFYSRLFQLDPELRPMFSGTDMKDQGRKLMQTLAVVVRGLDHLDQLLPSVQSLGRRHTEYGVRDEHYTTVGSALLWTLEQGLGELFTPDVRNAWAEAYGVVSGVMKQAAAEVEAPLPDAV